MSDYPLFFFALIYLVPSSEKKNKRTTSSSKVKQKLLLCSLWLLFSLCDTSQGFCLCCWMFALFKRKSCLHPPLHRAFAPSFWSPPWALPPYLSYVNSSSTFVSIHMFVYPCQRSPWWSCVRVVEAGTLEMQGHFAQIYIVSEAERRGYWESPINLPSGLVPSPYSLWLPTHLPNTWLW